MPWQEISFEIPSPLAPKCSERLETLGALSVSYFDAENTPLLEPLPGATPLWDKVKIVGLFEGEAELSSVRQALTASFPDLNVTINNLPDQDWERTWLEHFKPIQFGQNLWIIPSETPADFPIDNNATIVKLDPGLAFGTGTHATTALCLEWLEAHPPIQHTVLDYGCGSGILAIAALKLGAKQAYAVDYDPQALIATKENALRNQIENQIITLTPQALDPNFIAHTVLANILAEPLIQLAPTLSHHCAINGHLVLSGLLATQAEKVQAAYAPWFDFDEIIHKEEWVLLSGVKRR